MKLNKKGFGVAEIAIVVLLIGILAAAVIAGFMGIKKNATEHVKEEATKSLEIIHQTKHAYPTILSGDISRLEIQAGEYEVYELGGYSINGAATPGSTRRSAVINKGTLYITGNGTLDKSNAINANKDDFTNGGYAVYNYGEIHLSDMVLIGGGKYSGSNKIYAFTCTSGGSAVLDNVYFHTTNGGFCVDSGASLLIKGTNTYMTNINSDRTGTYYFYSYCYTDPELKDPEVWSTIIVEDGTFHMSRWCTAFAYILYNSKLTIKGGTFEKLNDNTKPKYGFTVATDGIVEIEGGLFTFPVSEKLFNVSGNGQIVISGGEFAHSVKIGIAEGSSALKITGGAFQWDPRPYLPETHTAVQKLHMCQDGVERTMWVVSEK